MLQRSNFPAETLLSRQILSLIPSPGRILRSLEAANLQRWHDKGARKSI